MKKKLSLKSRKAANETPLENLKTLTEKNPLLIKLIKIFHLEL